MEVTPHLAQSHPTVVAAVVVILTMACPEVLVVVVLQTLQIMLSEAQEIHHPQHHHKEIMEELVHLLREAEVEVGHLKQDFLVQPVLAGMVGMDLHLLFLAHL
jgi:hypothetical protein